MRERRARRLREVPPTIFATMSGLALRTGSVNLGQGFPDTDGPPGAIVAAIEAMRSGRNQYAPGPGVPELREAIAAQRARDYGIELDPDTQIVVTAGATEAIAAAILGLIDPGDEVAVVEPYYDSYAACLEMAGATRRPVPLVRAGDRFALDLEALERAVTDRTRVLLMNSPHNPTGSVLTLFELEAIASAARAHDVLVITDEAYESLTFDGIAHVPIATLPGMWERTVSLSSAGKTFSLTGWKVGWATGPADLVEAVMSAKQWLTYTNAAPLQPAIAHALNHEQGFVAAQARDLQSRRDHLLGGLCELGLDPVTPRGTYFTLTDVAHLGWNDGQEFCAVLAQRAGVVAIPAQGFYEDPASGLHQVRWAFCKRPEVIDRALRRLASADLHA